MLPSGHSAVSSVDVEVVRGAYATCTEVETSAAVCNHSREEIVQRPDIFEPYVRTRERRGARARQPPMKPNNRMRRPPGGQHRRDKHRTVRKIRDEPSEDDDSKFAATSGQDHTSLIQPRSLDTAFPDVEVQSRECCSEGMGPCCDLGGKDGIRRRAHDGVVGPPRFRPG
jgi:hypothetical protein